MQSKPKIAFVSNTAWSLFNFRLGVIRMCVSRGMEIFLLAPKDEYSAKLTAEGAILIPIRLINYSTNPIDEILLFYSLWRIYTREKFDLIFHYTIKPNIYGTLAAKLANLPSIAITTGLGRTFKFRSKAVNFATLHLYKLAGRYCSQMWFLNQSDKETFLLKKIVKREKCFILPSEGINLRKFQPSYKIKNSPITRFLFAGRLLVEKGIYEFIEAARALKKETAKIRFEVLGFIDEDNAYSVSSHQILTWQKEGVIKYLGSTEDVRPYISRADCIVFPSYYREGISRILLESASMEKPIITSDNIGCKDVVIDGYNGLLCKPRSATDLIRTIRHFLKLSDADRKTMGRNGRIFVRKKYNEEDIIEIYHTKIKDLLNLPKDKTEDKTAYNNVISRKHKN